MYLGKLPSCLSAPLFFASAAAMPPVTRKLLALADLYDDKHCAEGRHGGCLSWWLARFLAVDIAWLRLQSRGSGERFSCDESRMPPQS